MSGVGDRWGISHLHCFSVENDGPSEWGGTVFCTTGHLASLAVNPQNAGSAFCPFICPELTGKPNTCTCPLGVRYTDGE
jgi:hypothetical protein